MMKTVDGVEATTKSQADKIEQLMQWSAAVRYTERDVEEIKKDLNALGKRVTEQETNQTAKLNGLRQSVDREINELRTKVNGDISNLTINDIGPLKSFERTTRTLGIIALSLSGTIILGFIAVVVALIPYIIHFLTGKH